MFAPANVKHADAEQILPWTWAEDAFHRTPQGLHVIIKLLLANSHRQPIQHFAKEEERIIWTELIRWYQARTFTSYTTDADVDQQMLLLEKHHNFYIWHKDKQPNSQLLTSEPSSEKKNKSSNN